jgi:membrane protein implicated in regulation of membrane protease activity
MFVKEVCFIEQWVVWLSIVIILAFVEISTINLVSIWFVLSGIISLIVSFFTDSYIIQFGVFVICGVVLLVVTKPMVNNLIKHKKTPTNFDRIIGENGVVTEKIEKNNYGEVKVDGKKWTAFADEAIDVGCTIKILKIDGVKLKVEREDEC